MKRGFLAFAAIVFVLVAASCSGNGAGVPDGGTVDASTNPCAPGNAIMCGTACVDVQSDFQNCGACGNKCPATEVCSHGACATVCGGGSSRCNSSCVDLTADVYNCGGCGKQCPSGNVCNKGTCALTCQSGLTNCTGDCVDTTQNDSNCGACGNACAGGQICQNSQCVATCETGWSSCPVGDAGATSCVDTQFDPNNCGGCGKACPAGNFCSPVKGVGTCGLKCLGGTSVCSGKCVDEQIDKNNCGACASLCAGSCSEGHCCAAGQLYCSGACHTLAQCITLGAGKIAAGGSHTCGINSSGVLKCWGYGFDGELGDGLGTSSLTPVTVANKALKTPIYISAGQSHTCAIETGGTAYCWGNGFSGQLGDGLGTSNNSPSLVTGIATATKIDAGGDHTCVLLSTGTVKCWGGNVNGEVGDKTVLQRNSPVATGITAAIDVNAGLGFSYHSCAALSTGAVQCWGYNFDGEVGDGTSTERDMPTGTSPKLTSAAAVSVGDQQSCAVLSNATLECWGGNFYGETGVGNNTSPQLKPVVALATNVIAVSAGSSHTCALQANGAVQCWGGNFSGQLGDGTTTDNVNPVTPIASGAVAIAAGGSHTCAILASGKAQCWGYNGDGELGDGTGVDSSVPVNVKNF